MYFLSLLCVLHAPPISPSLLWSFSLCSSIHSITTSSNTRICHSAPHSQTSRYVRTFCVIFTVLWKNIRLWFCRFVLLLLHLSVCLVSL
jgi:hypothetical protein